MKIFALKDRASSYMPPAYAAIKQTIKLSRALIQNSRGTMTVTSFPRCYVLQEFDKVSLNKCAEK